MSFRIVELIGCLVGAPAVSVAPDQTLFQARRGGGQTAAASRALSPAASINSSRAERERLMILLPYGRGALPRLTPAAVGSKGGASAFPFRTHSLCVAAR